MWGLLNAKYVACNHDERHVSQSLKHSYLVEAYSMELKHFVPLLLVSVALCLFLLLNSFCLKLLQIYVNYSRGILTADCCRSLII